MNSCPLIEPDELCVDHYACVNIPEDGRVWLRVFAIDDEDFMGEDEHGGVTMFRREDVVDGRIGLVVEDYRRVLRAQSASNVLALVHALSDIVPCLVTDCAFRSVSPMSASDHPIFQLYLHQINYLTHGTSSLSQTQFEEHFNVCDRISISDTLSVRTPTHHEN